MQGYETEPLQMLPTKMTETDKEGSAIVFRDRRGLLSALTSDMN